MDNALLLHKIGFDFIELGLSGITSLNPEDYTTLLDKVNKSPIKPYAFNVLLPGTIKVTGDDFNIDNIKSYIEKAFTRASELGGQIVVFGSGGARKVAEDFCMDKAFLQLVEFLKIAAPIAEEHNLTVVIEPLRKEETNIINTASEGLRLAKAVAHKNVRLLIDFYHMTCENEHPDIILEAGNEYIKHIHIANPSGRIWPLSVTESEYKPFFDNLKKINYTAGISIEGRTDDLEKDAPISFDCLSALIK
jgi:sugar phosphate isomerase/epimerase